MSESAKERAFIHGLTVEPDWTAKFTAFLDEKVDLGTPETVTYINAGTGSHAIQIASELGSKGEVFPVCQSPEMQSQAQAKANTEKVQVDFSTSPPMAASEVVIADVSLETPDAALETIGEAAKSASDLVVAFLPVSGSYGEVFSFLWEVLFEEGKQSEEVEALINSLPTVSHIEDEISKLGFSDLNLHTKNDFVEFEDGEAFNDSLLVKKVLFPKWSSFLDENEKERILKRLAQKIDEESEGVTFRMSVKILVIDGSF